MHNRSDKYKQKQQTITMKMSKDWAKARKKNMFYVKTYDVLLFNET